MSQTIDKLLKNKLELRNQIADKQYELDDAWDEVHSFAKTIADKYGIQAWELKTIIDLAASYGEILQQAIALKYKDVPSIMVVGDDMAGTQLNKMLDAFAAKEHRDQAEYGGIEL